MLNFRKEMVVKNGILKDDIFYFISSLENILWALNIVTGKLKIVQSFSNKEENGIELFSTIIEKESKLYILPRNGKNAIFYDLKTRKIKKIKIDTQRNKKEKSINLFFSAIYVDNYIYLNPGMHDKILKLNSRDCKIEDTIIVKTTEKMFLPYFGATPCVWKNKIIYPNIYAEKQGYYYTFLDLEKNKMYSMVECSTLSGYVSCVVKENLLIGMYRDGHIDVWDLVKEDFVYKTKGKHKEDLYYRNICVTSNNAYGFSYNTGKIAIYNLSDFMYKEKTLVYDGYTYVNPIANDRVLVAVRNSKFIILSLKNDKIIIEQEYNYERFYYACLVAMNKKILTEKDDFNLKMYVESMKENICIKKNSINMNKFGTEIFNEIKVGDKEKWIE